MLESPEVLSRLITKFKVETTKHLDNLKASLPRLVAAPEDEEALKQVFLLVHTIKGNLGMMLLLDDVFAKFNPYAQNLEKAALALQSQTLRLEPALLKEFYENISLIEYNFADVA